MHTVPPTTSLTVIPVFIASQTSEIALVVAKWRIPRPYFTSLTIRKILLRMVIASGLPALAINIFTGLMLALGYDDGSLIGARLPDLFRQNEDTNLRFLAYISVFCIVASVLVSSVLLHHILRLWPRKIWTVRSEFIYSIVELVFVTGYLIFETFLSPKILGNCIIGIVDAVLLWLSIVALFVIMVWDMRISKYETMKSTYDLMENYDGVVSSWRRIGIGRWSLLFGENLFRGRFGMDRAFVRVLRAGISILCVFAMVALAIRVLILRPIQQEPVFKGMQTVYPEDYVIQDNTSMRMRLQVVIGGVKSLWFVEFRDVDIEWQPGSQPAECTSDEYEFGGIICNVPSPFYESAPEYLIIKINYTSAPVASLRTGVYLNFSPHPTKIFSDTTKPIPLYPGLHLFGITSYSFKDTFASTSDLALGIPRYTHELVAKIQALLPDPEFTSLSPDNTTATLKLTYQDGSGAAQFTYDIQQEQSTDSVLSGFAVLGGAWTFVSGVFAMVFGCKLLLVLFGIKPLSIYGLIHLFQRRRSLADGGYTLSVEEQSRTIAVLRAHLLDDDDDVEANGANKECDSDEERSHLHRDPAV